ncbi:hypothetical protein ANCCAN_05755, partial [Ancylostoma caninum]
MGPVTRSMTHSSDSSAVATTPVSSSERVTAPLAGALANLDDASTVHGKEAKELRDAATEALVNVWRDARQSTSQLAQQFNQVRAATAGQDSNTQKERVLEEFVARLRSDIRYFVKLDNPTTFEQAVTKAQTVEQLLSEAASERLMNPTATPQTVA